MFPRIRGLLSGRNVSPPPLVFLTHAKAGSTWVDQIMRGIYGKQVAPRLFETPDVFSFTKHRIYSAVFMNRTEYLRHPELFGVHRFVVIRDLRDTLISQYFSTRDTHGEDPAGHIATRRKILQERTQEEGLLYMIENVIQKHATIQESWLGTETPLFRYEEILQRDTEIFTDLLINRFGHCTARARIEKAVKASRFENVFGRQLGVEDSASHGRSGLPGGWRNHFSPAVASKFQERFGRLLIDTGYEKDGSWVNVVSNADEAES